MAEGSPWQPRRITADALREVTRKVLLTVWNTYYFFVTYACLSGWTPQHPPSSADRADRPIMDRYILAELADTIETVDPALEDFVSTCAGRPFAELVSCLSRSHLRHFR